MDKEQNSEIEIDSFLDKKYIEEFRDTFPELDHFSDDEIIGMLADIFDFLYTIAMNEHKESQTRIIFKKWKNRF